MLIYIVQCTLIRYRFIYLTTCSVVAILGCQTLHPHSDMSYSLDHAMLLMVISTDGQLLSTVEYHQILSITMPYCSQHDLLLEIVCLYLFTNVMYQYSNDVHVVIYYYIFRL